MASGHSPPAPLPLRQDKNKICSLQKSGSAKAEQKEKHTSYNSVYAATASLTVSLRPYPRYARTSHTRERYVKYAFPFSADAFVFLTGQI